jgi:hypothetical protein
MKELHFRRWVKVVLQVIIMLALMLLCSVDFVSIMDQILFSTVCLLIITCNCILLGIFE